MNHLHWLCCIALMCMLPLNSRLYAQNCSTCATQKYVYWGCDSNTGTETLICTDNPRSTPNFRPWKKCFPMQIRHGDFPLDIDGYLYYEKNGERITIFDEFVAKVDATVALNQWKDICTPDNQNCDTCSPYIIWARDERLMKGNTMSVWGITHMPIFPTAGTPQCAINCAGSYIAINMTDKWIVKNDTATDPKERYQRFFYTNRQIDTLKKSGWDDYYSLIQHELGHWLGFGHPYDFRCNMNGGGIMDRWGPGENHLNFHDKCMFMKLYCCPAIVGVEEEKSDEYQQVGELKVFPNPATQSISFELPPSYIGSSLHIRLCSLTGDVVAEYTLQAASPRQSLPLPPVAAGSYYIILSSNRGERSRGMVVIR